MGKRKLLLSGSSIAELRKECQEFLKETAGIGEMVNRYEPDYEDETTKQLALTPQPRVTSYPETPAPVAVPTGSAPITSTGELDARGVPWDSRVHSSSKEKTVKGSWRKRRGVEDADLARIEAELLQRASAAPIPSVPSSSVLAPQPPSIPVAPVGNVQQYPPPPVSPAPVAPVIPLAPPVPTATIVSLAHNLATFKPQMPVVLAELVKQGKINQEWLAAVKQSCGVQEIWQLTEEQQAELFETLCQYNLITRMP